MSWFLAGRAGVGRAGVGRAGLGRALLGRFVAAGVLAAPLLAGGCGDDGRERQHVLARIDALRDGAGAPVDDRRRLLEALRSAPGDEPAVAQARDRCVAAYADLVEANAIEENARAAMATGEKVDTILLARQLEQATRLLESSRGAMPACDRAATDLRATR